MLRIFVKKTLVYISFIGMLVASYANAEEQFTFYTSGEAGFSGGKLDFERYFIIQRDTVDIQQITENPLSMIEGELPYPYDLSLLPRHDQMDGELPEGYVIGLSQDFDINNFIDNFNSNPNAQPEHTTITKELFKRNIHMKHGGELGLNLGYIIDKSKTFEISYNNYNIHNKEKTSKTVLNGIVGALQLTTELAQFYQPYLGIGLGLGVLKAKYIDEGDTVLNLKNENTGIIQFNLGNTAKITDSIYLDMGYKYTAFDVLSKTQTTNPPFYYAAYNDDSEILSAVKDVASVNNEFRIRPIQSLYLRIRFMF